jgi:hypothetical protein
MFDLVVRFHLELRSNELLIDARVGQCSGAVACRGERIHEAERASGAQWIE